MSAERHGQLEGSIDGGMPAYFYELWYGNTAGSVYRYNSTKDDQILNGSVWPSAVIKHGEIALSGNLDRSTLELTAVEDIPAAGLFVGTTPSTPVVLTVFRAHISILGEVEEDSWVQVWTGRILSVKWVPEEGTIVWGCEPSSTSVRRLTLRRYYQYGCTHVLYGPLCKLSSELHTGNAVVTQVYNSKEFLVDVVREPHGMDNGANMNGGRIKAILPDGRVTIRSLQETQRMGGSTFRMALLAPMTELAVGLRLEMQRGCKHTWEACQTFDNLPNFGGCPNIPEKNPFVTSME